MLYPPRQDDGTCEFCGVVSGRVPSRVRYQDEELIVFRNTLTWVSVMLLIAPKEHMTQTEFWRSPLFARASALAVELGEKDAPGGFRLVSNFGDDALQTQPHGHLHIIGGANLGLYMDFPRKGDFWLRNYGRTDFDQSRYPKAGGG